MEKLSVEYELNYVLFAIQAKIDDYQFAYFLNKSPFFMFLRMPKDIIYFIKKTPVHFSSFYYCNEDLKQKSFLIKNKALYNSDNSEENSLFMGNNVKNTAFLMPELKNFDYLIKLVGIWQEKDLLSVNSLFKDLTVIDSAVNINLSKLKYSNNLVF